MKSSLRFDQNDVWILTIICMAVGLVILGLFGTVVWAIWHFLIAK